MNGKITAIILAAGQGKRMNTPVAKQFLNLRDKPVLYYSIKAFEESCVDEIVLVTGHGQVEYCKDHIVDHFHFNKVRRILEGGEERYDSVYQAILGMEPAEYILIHDGARPFITVSLINRIIYAVEKDKACITATPIKDTIKVVDQNGQIISTPDRSTLWSAQTPQAFEYKAIRKAYELFRKEKESRAPNITDDAMVYEAYLQKPVKIVIGDYINIKLTTPEDMLLAQALAENFFHNR